jgi:hypothetical protein
MPTRIERLLNQYSNPELGPKRQVNVRIELHSFVRLELLAEHYSVTRSSIAGDLLEVAIADATDHLFSNLDESQKDELTAGFQQALFELEHEQ